MDLGHLFIDTVTYSQPASFSDGALVQGAQSTAKGRLEESYDTITLSGGEERTSAFKFATATDIPLFASVFVPDADTGVANEALTVLRRKTARTLDGGYRYYILWLGR